MEQTFYQFGVAYLRWECNGHIYEAVKEQVDFFGKEFFEWNPFDNEEQKSDCLIPLSEKQLDFVDSFYEG